MAGTVRALVVVLLVVSAGCVGLSGRSLPDELAGYAGDPDNPYHGDELVVAVGTENTSREFGPVLEEALEYWERNDERYLDYSVNFTVAPDASDPDLRVVFSPTLARCGEVTNAAGCAPQVTNPAQTAETVEIQVLANLSDESTARVVEHELGHALGLGHDDEPRNLMHAHAVLTTLPTPNATDRRFAWSDPTLAVFLDTDDLSPTERAAVREQVGHALDYYDRGAAGSVPTNVSFELTENPQQADVVIRFPETSPCGLGPGSCGSVLGADSDGDGALERYSHVEISLTDLDTDAVGWHVARWLALGFGIETESEYPPPLREETSYEERREEWWR